MEWNSLLDKLPGDGQVCLCLGLFEPNNEWPEPVISSWDDKRGRFLAHSVSHWRAIEDKPQIDDCLRVIFERAKVSPPLSGHEQELVKIYASKG